MATSAEQIHHGNFTEEPAAGADLRLFVDLDVCASGVCGECTPECSYFYHPQNNGVASIAELATYALALMEDRKITSLVVVDADRVVQGLVHLHDLWKTEMI